MHCEDLVKGETDQMDLIGGLRNPTSLVALKLNLEIWQELRKSE
jgi:hypothetical protein